MMHQEVDLDLFGRTKVTSTIDVALGVRMSKANPLLLRVMKSGGNHRGYR